MNTTSLATSARNAWFAVAAGLAAGGVTALLGPISPSGRAAAATRVGASVHGEPLALAALAVGAVSVGRSVDAKTAGVWTGLGAAPAVWWLVVGESTAAVVGAETATQFTVLGVGFGVSLAVGFLITILLTVLGAVVGAWTRRRSAAAVERVTAG